MMSPLRNAGIAAAACGGVLMTAHLVGGAHAVSVVGTLLLSMLLALAMFFVFMTTDESASWERATALTVATVVFVVFGLTGLAGTYFGYTMLSLFIVGITGFVSAACVDEQRAKEERALRRAEKVASGEAAAEARQRSAEATLEGVEREWLLDLFPVPENTQRAALIRLVADLPEGTEYALVRAHRKGVNPDAVASFVAVGAFTEADADLLAGKVA